MSYGTSRYKSKQVKSGAHALRSGRVKHDVERATLGDHTDASTPGCLAHVPALTLITAASSAIYRDDLREM